MLRTVHSKNLNEPFDTLELAKLGVIMRTYAFEIFEHKMSTNHSTLWSWDDNKMSCWRRLVVIIVDSTNHGFVVGQKLIPESKETSFVVRILRKKSLDKFQYCCGLFLVSVKYNKNRPINNFNSKTIISNC